ncbi:hypothetical protein [Arundinibacter roseus]|uniref:TIGR03066 family protein n=1 Tax=Arundinibacter roseus TaxID=2070510 RepID=A0A4R4KHI0_9BACT|nr:hypothetical protein [Arundinibacter roseus]TDB67557.1 hypothetical protein EZE20_06340 [Arundinibacter roseus]
MKKNSLLLLFLVLGLASKGFSQTTQTTDFFVGKWEVLIKETPNGDAKLMVDLVRTDGKLSGEMSLDGDTSGAKTVLTDITEDGDKLGFGFSAQGYDVTMDLTKVDDDTLKGSLLNMFDAIAKRIPQPKE